MVVMVTNFPLRANSIDLIAIILEAGGCIRKLATSFRSDESLTITCVYSTVQYHTNYYVSLIISNWIIE